MTALVVIGGLAAASVAQASPSTTAARAVAGGRSAVLALLARNNFADDMALLPYSTTTITTTSTPVSQTKSSGCWSQDADTHKITVAGVVLGGQRLIVGGFCWRKGRLTQWGGDSVQRWSAFLYCWSNTSGPDDWWFYIPTWRRASISGELGGNSGFGCIGLQNDHDWMGYGLNRGRPEWVHH
jgi:hypothetical protein